MSNIISFPPLYEVVCTDGDRYEVVESTRKLWEAEEVIYILHRELPYLLCWIKEYAP